MDERVFVYGTLKSGYGNNRLLTSSKKIGDGVTRGNYLLTCGGFPFANPEGGSDDRMLPVRGEVYQVTEQQVMDNLDRLEGNGTFYTRAKRSIIMDDGSEEEAWIYEISNYGGHSVCPIIETESGVECYEWSRGPR